MKKAHGGAFLHFSISIISNLFRISDFGFSAQRGSGHEWPEPRNFTAVGYFTGWTGLPSLMAQPPLPLQEFFPPQPLSPLLQPPLPLQVFLPAQPWSGSGLAASARTPARLTVLPGCAVVAAVALP